MLRLFDSSVITIRVVYVVHTKTVSDLQYVALIAKVLYILIISRDNSIAIERTLEYMSWLLVRLS